jgi:hypothetical protein
MEFQVGQRVVRKTSEQSGFIHEKRRGKVVMLEVRWEESGIKQWLPAEEFRLWDKSATPPPSGLGYRGRTTPDYISRIRSSKQCKDERNRRYGKMTRKELEEVGNALMTLAGNKKQRGRNKAKKIVAPWIRKENLDVQCKTAIDRDK